MFSGPTKGIQGSLEEQRQIDEYIAYMQDAVRAMEVRMVGSCGEQVGLALELGDRCA